MWNLRDKVHKTQGFMDLLSLLKFIIKAKFEKIGVKINRGLQRACLRLNRKTKTAG